MDSAREAGWVLDALRARFNARGEAVEDLQVRPLIVAGGIVSKIYTAEGTVASDHGRRLSLFCKLPEDEPMRTSFHLEMHFSNEILFFEDLLPFLLAPAGREDDVSRLFPWFHFAHRDHLQLLVAMDNLTTLGYVPARGVFDLQHAVLAWQALGTFHALSYIAKKRNPKQFHALMARLLHPRKNTILGRKLNAVNINFVQHTASMFREAQPEESAKYSKQLEEVINDASVLYGRVCEGREPMSVLCHGDFKNENIMFRYDEEGNPVSLKVIDFQLVSYSSPAIDVFFLLFMSTPLELWNTHWSTLFAGYHNALLRTASRYLNCPVESLQDDLGPEVFKNEFKKYCHHGFYVCNFFEPFRSLEPEKGALLIKTLAVDDINLTETNPLIANLQDNYSDKMKYYLTAMLKYVLELKYSS